LGRSATEKKRHSYQFTSQKICYDEMKCEFETCKSEPVSVVLITHVMYIEHNIEARSPTRSSHGKVRVLYRYILSACLWP
jgi:hypothetical protein